MRKMSKCRIVSQFTLLFVFQFMNNFFHLLLSISKSCSFLRIQALSSGSIAVHPVQKEESAADPFVDPGIWIVLLTCVPLE